VLRCATILLKGFKEAAKPPKEQQSDKKDGDQ